MKITDWNQTTPMKIPDLGFCRRYNNVSFNIRLFQMKTQDWNVEMYDPNVIFELCSRSFCSTAYPVAIFDIKSWKIPMVPEVRSDIAHYIHQEIHDPLLLLATEQNVQQRCQHIRENHEGLRTVFACTPTADRLACWHHFDVATQCIALSLVRGLLGICFGQRYDRKISAEPSVATERQAGNVGAGFDQALR